jgi:hypothetical protein
MISEYMAHAAEYWTILRGNLSSDKQFEVDAGPRLSADGVVS